MQEKFNFFYKKPYFFVFLPYFRHFAGCFLHILPSFVRLTGLEPARRKTLDPKSSASTNSATGASLQH